MQLAIHDIGRKLWPNHIPQIPHCTSIIRNALAAAKKQLKSIRRQAKIKREEFLQALRARLAMRKGPSIDSDKAISNVEKQLRTTYNFKAIKCALKQQAFLPLNRVEIAYEEITTNADTNETTSETKYEIIDT